MKIEGVERVQAGLTALRNRIGPTSVTGIVGYTAKYALYVHENMAMVLQGVPRPSGLGVYWGPMGGSKFLETPAREMKDELGQIVEKALTKGKTLREGILLACLTLQRVSMDRVPVEYGFLRASAFTKIDDEREDTDSDVGSPTTLASNHRSGDVE